ncbi:MAG: MFS transporter [Candidatus Binatia bacterium]
MSHDVSPSLATRIARLPFFYGWVVIAVAFITMAIGVNVRTAFSLLFPPILAEFGWDRGSTAAAFSIGFVASTLYVPLIGVLMDRFGPRYVIPLGAVLVSAGMILATYVSQPWHLHATLGVLVGGGSIFMTYLGHSLFLPYWFVRQRGLAIGIAFAGVGVGSMILFPWVQTIITDVGWRHACWVMAAVLLVAVIPLNVILQRRRPEDVGLEPDGMHSDHSRSSAERHHDNVVDHAWVATDWTLSRALRTTRFWWLVGAMFGSLHAWYAVQVHQTKYLGEIGFPVDTAAYALGLVGLTGSVGQIAIGHLSDRIGREWAWTISVLGFTVCYAILLVMPHHPSRFLLYLMVAAQGLLGYGLAAAYGAVPAELFQGRNFGTISATLSVGGNLGAGFGPWITGMLYDRTGTYDAAFWLAIVLSFVSIFCIWMAAPRKVRVVAGQIERLRVLRTAE